MIAAYLLRRKALRFFIARPQRGRGNLGKAVAISPIVACYPTGYCEIATSACGLLAMTNLETSAVGGVHGNLQLPKALTERRYRRNRCVTFCRQPVPIGSIAPGGDSRPLQLTAGGLRMIHSSFFSLQYSFIFVPLPYNARQGPSRKNAAPVGLSNILYSELDRRKPV